MVSLCISLCPLSKKRPYALRMLKKARVPQPVDIILKSKYII